jgi:hypothetical protein
MVPCDRCGQPLEPPARTGRERRWCGSACRQAAYRVRRRGVSATTATIAAEAMEPAQIVDRFPTAGRRSCAEDPPGPRNGPSRRATGPRTRQETASAKIAEKCQEA